MRFDSQIQVGAELPSFDALTIKNEPMMFSADVSWAHEHGGPITRAFIEALPAEFQSGILDSRVHMLMPGWYPCIPGWHHDDVPRSTPNGQPNYFSPEYRSRHAMALVGGLVCPTEFALGQIDLDVPETSIYRTWHPLVEQAIRHWVLERKPCPDGFVVMFDWQTFHQGTRAVANGWRWFGRVSIDTHRKPANEIRQQVQVYLESPMEGW